MSQILTLTVIVFNTTQKYKAKKNRGNLIKPTAFRKEMLLKKIKFTGLIIKYKQNIRYKKNQPQLALLYV
jgi:hypothetical protein